LTPPPVLEVSSFQSLAGYIAHHDKSLDEFARRRDREFNLLDSHNTIHTKGYCFVCKKLVNFQTDFLYSDPQHVIGGQRIPNWRERLICSVCQMNSRVRGAIHFFEGILEAVPDDEIYVTEYLTPLYLYLQSKYKKLVASEYLGDAVPFGETDPSKGARNESLARLTFADDSFNFILSFDVLEHIPDYLSAFRECLRCLKPGGTLLFSAPFDRYSASNLVRAVVDERGEIEHIMPPEYHGDPVNVAGCLCFYHFGWELIGQIHEAGFVNASAHFFWSDPLGYLGDGQILLTAKKPG